MEYTCEWEKLKKVRNYYFVKDGEAIITISNDRYYLKIESEDYWDSIVTLYGMVDINIWEDDNGWRISIYPILINGETDYSEFIELTHIKDL